MLFSLDSSGTMASFSQLIRILCIFRFTNVFFGDLLENLLANFGDATDKSEIRDQDSYILNQEGRKGKFDTYERALSTTSTYSLKIVFYLISWLCRLVARILTETSKRKKRITKLVFYFVYFHQKIHFGIFTAFISSGVLLTTRTILHTKLFPNDYFLLFDKFISALCFLLVLADFHILFATAIDYRCYYNKESLESMEEKRKKQKKLLLDKLEGKKNAEKGNQKL